MKEYHSAWYQRNRERVLARVAQRRQITPPSAERTIVHLDARRERWKYLLTHPCVDCGEADPIVLEFDHLGKKTSAIADMMRLHARWDEILVEIAKCEVRCANCHRRRTARARGYYRELTTLDPMTEVGMKEDASAYQPWFGELRPRTGLNRRPAVPKTAALIH